MYPSGDLSLKAWLYVPEIPNGETRPAVVFFHGGFAFAAGDFWDCQPLFEAGFVVMTPMLRGENGNPGNFEMFWGEVDDAAAAVRWISEQSYVDSERVYALGHSVGGGISALLSLRDDVPLRHCASIGGLYGPAFFDDHLEILPFNPVDPQERILRLLSPNLRWMQTRHYAYIGEEDYGIIHMAQGAQQGVSESKGLLEIITVPGDHFSSIPPAMGKYAELIASDR